MSVPPFTIFPNLPLMAPRASRGGGKIGAERANWGESEWVVGLR